MKKTLALLLSVLFFTAQAKENYPNLAASNIPENLKVNAHAVYRYDSTKIIVDDINKARFIKNYAVTILDEKGLYNSVLIESYNNSIVINDIDAILLDASGKEIKSLKNREVFDRSAFGGNAVQFDSDQRFKMFDFQHKVYPYTIIFKIDETIKSLFFLPDWNVRNSLNASVESNFFSLSFKGDNPIRFKEYQMPESIKKTAGKDEAGNEHFTWSLSNLPVIANQPHSQTGNFDVPNIQLCATKFELYSYKGEANSWKDLGAFVYKLNEGRDDLPEDKKAAIKTMVANEPNDYAKIQKLYAYMQQSTHYVGDQYGISGFQTFEAKDVARTGYGDCKGLSNYLKALLKAADIKAYMTLASAGEDDYFKLDRDFTANGFNHAILCVPQPKDTLWIECTSQILPAGYLGSFTQDRDVLILTENGGILTHTPAYNQANNYVIRKATMKFDPQNTDQIITINNQYSGLTQDNLTRFIKTESEKEVRDLVNQKFPFTTYSVKSYNYKQEVNDNHIPSLIENVEVLVSDLITGTQKRTFIDMGWTKNPMTDLFQIEERTLPIVLDKSFTITDSVIIDLPERMEIESMPAEKHIIQPFAEYNLQFNKSGQHLVMVRTFVQKRGIYEAALYKDYQKLFKDIQSEKGKLQIVLNNAP